ncbi:MAG: helical backbone metal receptor [Candidatus Cloacimonetes bacterium]|jgi:iron complex transport system substrate-binding protein|nr:helical backbone metal receptor [Candidatus Cloacimonadota bacterium]MCB5286405.1 helical backbone metal receptor [Candidatus Cloacimonadota bacterium]MCK9184248.1 helical backbone metal receptor [Candidatus Cloacimonadota bacterium]MCK9583394.1 helical backbone metal receptor [Candidatus Cloacimonadota bacterium]MDY0228727.1 helical backbone metal receptor [Candidatus Cloacimonadaceae bacterium]
MKHLYYSALILIILSTLCSCHSPKQDNAGRYVVLSPEIAEIIVALGAGDKIVGLTQECSYPPELLEKEIVGNFGAVKMEQILNLNPELVFTSALEQESIAEDLRKLGIRVESSYPKNLAEMQTEILRIAVIIGREAKGRELVSSIAGQIQKVKEMAEGRPVPKVYLEIYRDPLMSVADNSFVGELIETAGGDNVFQTLERDYSRIKAEDVIKANPDIMICYSQDSLSDIISRKGWGNIPAIKNQMVFFEGDIDPDLIQRAGPRCVIGMIKLNEIYALWERLTQ